MASATLRAARLASTPVTLGADLGEVESEAALVGADVEGFALSVTGGSGVVEALVEEGSGFLAGGGVEVEAESVEGKEGAQVGGAVEGVGSSLWEVFQVADAGVGALDESGLGEFFFEDFGEGGADIPLGCALG